MKIVKMYHDDPRATGCPTVADVPEDGVKMMKAAGWYLKVEDAQAYSAAAEKAATSTPSAKQPGSSKAQKT